MTENTFEKDFIEKFRDENMKIFPLANGMDFVVKNVETSRLFFVRTERSDDKKSHKEPAPFYNATAVVSYRFSINDPAFLPGIYVFIYQNNSTGRNEYIIIKTAELLVRMMKIPQKSDKAGFYKLIVWVLPDNGIFIANRVSAEGEWYLLGSGLWKGKEWDFSEYMNSWDIFN